MNKDVNILLKIKVFGKFDINPYLNKCNPFPVESIYALEGNIEVNKIGVYPLTWSYVSYDIENKKYNFNINNKNVGIKINENNLQTLKFIIELWHFNDDLGQYSFNWESENGVKCAWVQFMFNINMMEDLI
jgi:hypothetical protein